MGLFFNKEKIFSIIIPVYNGEYTIERALASLISNKKFIKEVVVINDCSTDGTQRLINKFIKNNYFNIKVIRNTEKLGVGYSRRIGIQKSKGEWITFLDADDCLTANSLRYVYEHIINNEDLDIVHTQTIYYESGTFNPNNIEYSDYSCGGNFYRRKYLIDNNLFPNSTLKMAEDQYFNEIIMLFMDYIDLNNSEERIGHYDYPVYEVHHDIYDWSSFALENWDEYCCKYHLLYKQYVVDYCVDNGIDLDIIRDDYVNNFIFCYYLANALVDDLDFNLNIEDFNKHFSDALVYFESVFNISRDYFINYFIDNKKEIEDIIKLEAEATVGYSVDLKINFEDFVNGL